MAARDDCGRAEPTTWWAQAIDMISDAGADPGTWTRLAPLGLGSVIAFYAGPKQVRPAADARKVAAEGGDDRPFWRDEISEVELGRQYVRAADLPEPPYVEWEIRLSREDTEALWLAVNRALESAAATSDVRISLDEAEKSAVSEAVERFLDQRR